MFAPSYKLLQSMIACLGLCRECQKNEQCQGSASGSGSAVAVASGSAEKLDGSSTSSSLTLTLSLSTLTPSLTSLQNTVHYNPVVDVEFLRKFNGN